MKKLILFAFIAVSTFAKAQVAAVNDTTIAGGTGASTQFTAQYRYQNTAYGRLTYRYNPALGKYDLEIDSKYLRAYYAPNTALASYVPIDRLVSTGYGLSGGGNLGGNLTLLVDTVNITSKTFFNTRIGTATAAAIAEAGAWQRASNRLSPVTATDTITGNLGKIKKLTVGNYTSPLWGDPLRQFVITAPGPLDTDISAMYMHNNKANILYTTSAHGNNDLGGVNSSWFYQGGYTPGLSGFDFNRVTYFSDGTSTGSGFDQVMNLVGNVGGANYNATHLLRGGMYWSKYVIDVNVDRFNPATMSHYASVDTTGNFVAKTFSGNDGTQGLVLGPYSIGAGFGAIYPFGVTRSNLNYVFAANPASQTVVNNPIKTALAVAGGSLIETTTARTDIYNDTYFGDDVYITNLTGGSAGNFVVNGGSGLLKTRTAAQVLGDIGAQPAITFGTGVQSALGVNIGSAGAPVLFNGAGGTPSSITLTNATGTASGLTAGAVTNGVYTTGTQSIGGSKTFTSIPIISTPLAGIVYQGGTIDAFLYNTGNVFNIVDNLTTSKGLRVDLGTGALTQLGTGAVTFAGNVSAPNLTSGTYTPTVTNIANVSSSSAQSANYSRVGNTVTVSGSVNITNTGANTGTSVELTLPIASNFGSFDDCSGVGQSTPGLVGGVTSIIFDANSSNGKAILTCQSNILVGSQTVYFVFTYKVI